MLISIKNRLVKIFSGRKFLPVWMLHVVLCVTWIVFHTHVIHYGADQLPYHEAFIGDERAPITGALHILAERNPLALNGLETMYYGPLFAMLALPAVVIDFAASSLANGTFSAAVYHNRILFDWGGTLVLARTITLLVSYLGLVALFKILTTKTINPSRSVLFPVIGVALLASDFFFFAYGSFFRFWIFILVPVLWQLYYLVRMYEEPERSKKYLVYQGVLAVFAFGINYPSVISQVLLVPWVYSTWRKLGFKQSVRVFLPYIGIVIAGCIVIAAWNWQRLTVWVSIFLNDTLRLGVSEVSLTQVGERTVSFPYYLEMLLHNYFSLIIVLSLLVVVSVRKRLLSKQVIHFVLATAIFGIAYSAFIGFHPVHVSRYILPTVLTLIVMVSVLLTVSFNKLGRLTRIVISLLLVFQIAFHVVTVYFWLDVKSDGPTIRQEIAKIIHDKPAVPGVSQIVMPGSLLGWPHTKRSYEQYTTLTNEGYRPLFQSYQAATPPDIPLLDVHYVNSVAGVDLTQYNMVYACSDLVLEGIVPVDYPEVRLVRFWGSERIWLPSCTRFDL